MIRFSSRINILEKEKEYIKKCLPKWDTDVTEVVPERDFEISIRINARNAIDVQKWISAYQKLTHTCYSVESTFRCSGQRVLFKRSYHCQHRTRHKQTYDPVYRKRIRNTNCPSVFSVAIRAILKRYQGKDKTKAPDENKPCEIRLKLKHNHLTNNAMALKFQKVLPTVKEELIELFRQGHTATTALQTLKADIRLNYEKFEEILADRSICPDYAFCHYMYQKAKNDRNVLFNHEFLQSKLEEYNKNTNFESSRMVITENGYVICLCPPVVHRIHQFHQNSSEIVFIDYLLTSENVTKAYILSTTSELGALLPLGIIILHSISFPDISIGFNMLKEMLGNHAFNGNPEGPKFIFTDDSIIQNKVINPTWPASTSLMSFHHILKNMFKWLNQQKHSIHPSDRQVFFQDFYNMVYAESEEEFMEKYAIAKKNAEKHKSYSKYLKNLENIHLWALYHRPNVHFSSNYGDLALRMLQEKLFQSLKMLNAVQMTDFIINKLFLYFEQQLLDVAFGRHVRNIFYSKMNEPRQEISENIQILSEKIRLVPSERVPDLFYVVNTQLLTCTCFDGNSSAPCKHIQWICYMIYQDKIAKIVQDVDLRQKYYLIATGETLETIETVNENTLVKNESVSMETGQTNLETRDEKIEVQIHDNQMNNEFITSLDNSQSSVLNKYLTTKRNEELLINCRNNLAKMNSKIEELVNEDPESLLASLETIYSRLKAVNTVDGVSAAFGVEVPGNKIKFKLNETVTDLFTSHL